MDAFSAQIKPSRHRRSVKKIILMRCFVSLRRATSLKKKVKMTEEKQPGTGWNGIFPFLARELAG